MALCISLSVPFPCPTVPLFARLTCTCHEFHQSPTEAVMRSLLLLVLGIPIPIIILIALFVN